MYANIKRYAMRDKELVDKKQTAIEWLIDKLIEMDKLLDGRRKNEDATILKMNPIKLFEQAKAMEKEQISKAWDDGDYAYFHSKETGRDFDNGEQYYNETYNK